MRAIYQRQAQKDFVRSRQGARLPERWTIGQVKDSLIELPVSG